MDFYKVVDQVVKLLQQRGRLTYRSLKVQFKLDDATLEALKDELLFSHPVVDQDGRGVVWTGASEAKPAPVLASPSAQTSQPPLAEEELPPQVAPLSTEQRIPEAERRQLTVMFCDLVESTALSGQLDPEDYRDMVRAYQRVCTDVLQRYDGHIAQLLGDGLLIYFGYPHAHEDDPQRAVRAGLGMLAVMGDLNSRLQPDKGIQLAIRVGVHTGLVVVGEMGGQGRQEQLALGETPNIAARIQGLAAPNTVVISDATHHLVQGYFQCQDMGAQPLRGVAEPMRVYQVLRESGATSRLEVAQPRGLTPLVGRESEVTLLLERWEQVKAGHGQVVLLTGEAGIGKSRLVQMLKDYVANEPHIRWECRSAEYYQNTALFPLTDLFQRILRFEAHETPDEKLEKLAQALSQYRLPVEESVPLFAPLLSFPLPEHQYPPLNLSPQRQRQKTLEMIVAILLELAEHQPVLFILEDLHWTDPTTLEFLELLVEQVPATAIYALLTCRPHFQPAWHHRSYITEMTLTHLSYAQAEQIVHRITDGKTLPTEVLQQILAKTDGVPLFVEEMTKAILESGHLKDVDGHYERIGLFATFAIPATLHDSLMARLDRLVTAKAAAQYAAVIGRQFTYPLLQGVSQLDAITLQRELGRLVEAEIVYQRGVPPQATYTFKHALIQDAAYQSLLKSTRQQHHQRIAQVLEGQFPETAEAQPELLAHHYTEAGLSAQAVRYWQQAGQRTVERSANLEAVAHLRKGLEVLATLPDTPERSRQELGLQIILGPALMASKGIAAPEVGRAYARARELCRQVEDAPQVFSVLRGLWNFYLVRAEHQTAQELAEQLLALAQRSQTPAFLLEAHMALGISSFWQGAIAPARAHLEQASTLYDPQPHRAHAFLYGLDPGMASRCYAAWALWALGYPEQAHQRINEGLSLAQELPHRFSLAAALGYAAWQHQLRREGPTVQVRAEAAISLSTEQGFPHWLVVGTFLRGWALAAQGQAEEGITQLQQGLAAWRALGTKLGLPAILLLLAEAYGKAGQVEVGLQTLAEALALVDQTQERVYEAELYRLQEYLAPCGRTFLVHYMPDAPPMRTGHDGQRSRDERLGLTSAVLPA
jgi:class 3 adenylate cyclase/predicted ATPase